MNLEEKTLNSEKVLQGKILYVTKDTALLADGRKTQRDVIHHNGGVGVVPLTDKNTIYMVRQYRYPMHEVTLEIPAGKREGDEAPVECGKRELREETGCTASEYVDLGAIYPTPAYDTEVIYIYLAKGIDKCCEQDLDEGEFINVEEISLEKAYDMVMKGEIKDAKTQIAILKTYNIVTKGKQV